MKSTTSSKTIIQACVCKHEFQDKTYGPQKRVMNQLGKTKKDKFRCTVCDAEHGKRE